MKVFFVALGVLWIAAAAVSGFVGTSAGPTNGELLAVILVTGGALLLGVGYTVARLDALERGAAARPAPRASASSVLP